ncbi:MAG: hypothetical protein ACLFU8_13065 [Anaerolineales bacterium]
MFEQNLYQNQICNLPGTGHRNGDGARAIKQALSMFRRARFRGQVRRVLAQLTGRSTSLLSLREVEQSCTLRGRCDVGTECVPLKKIRGSESRCRDFDAEFNPRQARDEDRWVRVAAAWQTQGELPPVQLIRVGDVYFVRDGHHRISVARQRGQDTIDAEVTIWEVDGPLPWERPSFAGRRTLHQPA